MILALGGEWASVLGLFDRLAHMTEALDNARAEVKRLTALVEAVREVARDVATDAGDDKSTYGGDYHAGMVTVAARITQALAFDGVA